MEVLVHSRSDGVALQELLERSDFVSLHCPLTPETRHLIDAGALERMKDTAILVNTARGPIVDQRALAAALHTGTIAGAALDVTDPEPLPAGHPLWSAPGLIITPHVAGASGKPMARSLALARAQLERYAAGEPLRDLVGNGGY
jgi:glyoxylate reductase